MFTPLTLAAALLLAQAPPPAAGALALNNVRNTYGELGGTRPDGKLIPGDVLFVGFDIEGITIQPNGQVTYSMALEVIDDKGKAIFKQDPAEKVDFVPLGGNKLPARAFITVGLDQPPGAYTLKVIVSDKATKATKTLEKKFDVAPRDFGIVAVYSSVDERGSIPAPTTGIVGQSVFVQFSVVGFDRAPSKTNPKVKHPDVLVEMQTLDDSGKPTMEKPATFNLAGGVEEKESAFTLRFLLPLTRVGKFSVRLKAVDNIAKKSATFDLPIAVVPSAK